MQASIIVNVLPPFIHCFLIIFKLFLINKKIIKRLKKKNLN